MLRTENSYVMGCNSFLLVLRTFDHPCLSEHTLYFGLLQN